MERLRDRLLALQSRLEQRGCVWDDERSADIKRRVQLLSGLLDREDTSSEEKQIERSIAECERDWEATMNAHDPTQERGDLMAGQKAWRRFVDLESKFKNLEETVPPHAADWWNDNMYGWKADFDALRASMPGTEANPGPLADGANARVNQALDALEKRYHSAAEELGSRTAAGRAKAG